MRKHKKIRNKKIGLPPGSLVYVGDADIKHLDTLKITQITYDADGIVEACLLYTSRCV